MELYRRDVGLGVVRTRLYRACRGFWNDSVLALVGRVRHE